MNFTDTGYITHRADRQWVFKYYESTMSNTLTVKTNLVGFLSKIKVTNADAIFTFDRDLPQGSNQTGLNDVFM